MKIKEKLISLKRQKIMTDSQIFKNFSESINFIIAENRVLAENIYQCIPKYDNSTLMDLLLYVHLKKVDFCIVGDTNLAEPRR